MNTIAWALAGALVAVLAAAAVTARITWRHGFGAGVRAERKFTEVFEGARGTGRPVPAGTAPWPPEDREALAQMSRQLEMLSGQIRALGQIAGPGAAAAGGVTDTGTFMVPFKVRDRAGRALVPGPRHRAGAR